MTEDLGQSPDLAEANRQSVATSVPVPVPQDPSALGLPPPPVMPPMLMPSFSGEQLGAGPMPAVGPAPTLPTPASQSGPSQALGWGALIATILGGPKLGGAPSAGYVAGAHQLDQTQMERWKLQQTLQAQQMQRAQLEADKYRSLVNTRQQEFLQFMKSGQTWVAAAPDQATADARIATVAQAGQAAGFRVATPDFVRQMTMPAWVDPHGMASAGKLWKELNTTEAGKKVLMDPESWNPNNPAPPTYEFNADATGTPKRMTLRQLAELNGFHNLDQVLGKQPPTTKAQGSLDQQQVDALVQQYRDNGDRSPDYALKLKAIRTLNQEKAQQAAAVAAARESVKPPPADKSQNRPVLSTDARRIAEINQGLTQAADLRNTLSAGTPTGAMAQLGTLAPNALTEMTGFGKEAKQKNAKILLVKQIIGKGLEGGVLRKEDEMKYAAILPTIGDSPDVWQTKIDGLIAALTNKKESDVEALKSAGYQVDKLAGTGPHPMTSAPASNTRTIGGRQFSVQVVP